jgi:hypothetical protein
VSAPNQKVPLDPLKAAAIRRALPWMAVGYVPLLAGLGWAFVATSRWPGTRGSLLAASGLLICLAASSAMSLPFLRAVVPNRRLGTISIERYTWVTVLVAIAIAAALAVIAFAGSQE